MPNTMPSVIEYVRIMMTTVAITATATGQSSHFTPLSCVIMAAPTITMAPTVHV